jgi:hypothetical protein
LDIELVCNPITSGGGLKLLLIVCSDSLLSNDSAVSSLICSSSASTTDISMRSLLRIKGGGTVFESFLIIKMFFLLIGWSDDVYCYIGFGVIIVFIDSKLLVYYITGYLIKDSFISS